MPARRCSVCAANYTMDVKKCPNCGRTTWESQSSEPDEEPTREGDEYELGADQGRLYDPVAHEKIVDWRASCFVALGFSDMVAAALAVRRDVDRERVRSMIEAGASPAQAAAIML